MAEWEEAQPPPTMAIRRKGQQPGAPSSLPTQRQPPTEPLTAATAQPSDPGPDSTQDEQIRPQSLQDYVGQKALKEVLHIAIQAAQSRKEALEHLLFYGPPGLGKTTMALILAQEMGVNCKITAAPALERPRDITGLLLSLQPRDILFIDEIHRLNRVTEELLYSAMEDFRLDLTIGKGTSAKTRSLSLAPFTLIGATTKVGSLTSPLRDRFGLIQRLRFYELEELTDIVIRSAAILQTPITKPGAIAIARRSRGTPRIANRLLRRVRDYLEVKKYPEITEELAAKALDLFNVDRLGLNWTDRLVLQTLIDKFQGGPVGLETIAAATGEDSKTIEEVYEPYLLQTGLLNRTARGRIATSAAYAHLGYASQLDITDLL